MHSILAVFFTAFLCTYVASAQVAHFTPQEIQQHNANIHQIVQVSADCLDEVYADHLSFFSMWGVSKYYGDRNPKYATVQGRLTALQQYGKPAELIHQLEPISCIGLTLKCLQQGFEAVNMSTTWNKIFAQLKVDNKMYGTDLQKNLIALGWRSYYWNPNPANNKKWDEEDRLLNPLKPGKSWNPVWGGHEYRYQQALKGYYYEKDLYVHDAVSLVGFGDKQPTFFSQVPFFVGIAHAGYHVFPGRHGEVIEAHSMRSLNSKENLEFSEFNPLKKGGGPIWTSSEKYRSGVIVIPNL